MRKYIGLFVVLSFALAQAAVAATNPPTSDAEQAFVTATSTKLQQTYPTTASAKSSGYSLLFGQIGDDNTYDLTNFDFSSVTPDHPNFLWYDRQGHLAGADWELPKSSYATAPHLAAYPVQAARWVTIPEHVHFAYTLNGKTYYGATMAASTLRKGKITAQQLRAVGAKLPPNATLVWAMYHPAVWDLAMWLVPNPNGPFADKNPNVK